MKKIGKIPAGGGWKAHGRPGHNTSAHKKARIGYDYIHSAVDDHSRLAYSELLPDEQGPTTAAFLARALAFFADRGITVERLMTDNHWSYKRSADVAQVLAAARVRHVFIKPHCPWQNGKVCEHRGGAAPARSDPGQGMTCVSCVRYVDRDRCSVSTRTGQTELT